MRSAVSGASLGDRRIWLIAAYGFACGLPFPLSGFTLRQWMSEGGLSLGAIGLTANIGLAYSLKFLWAPLLDQVRPPRPLHRLGRRRGWLAAIQPALSLSCVLLALSRPAAAPLAAVAAAAAVAFFSASQDIVVDAWRIEIFPRDLQGAALAGYVWGYRLALMISGGGAIALAGRLGWHGSLLAMAALTVTGLLVTLIAPEPLGRVITAAPGAVARARAAVIAPLREFFGRPGALPILAFVVLFHLGEAMAGVMLPPFYRALGFDRAAVAIANGPISPLATLAGVTAGGWLVARLGLGRALILTGFGKMAAMLMYVGLAYAAGARPMLFATSMVEAFTEGLVDAAFIAYLSSLCAVAYTATQYALLSSLAVIASRTIGGFSGFMAAAVGWIPFYLLCTAAALPAMLIMLWLLRRYPPARSGVGPRAQPAASGEPA
ncbi:MAG: MFS transporter [Acidisphaera sp.]|nr:MFS transporter [Acidisphaera sp.]